MPDYRSPDGPTPPFPDVTCDDLFEVLLQRVDKPYEYTHIIAELICKALNATSANTIEFVDGVPMILDPNRGKVLSLARPIVLAGAHGRNKKDQYLKISEVPSAGANGFLIARKATITGIWGKSRSTGTWTLEARKNDVSLTLASTSISSGIGSSTNIDIDISKNDCLQIFAKGSLIDFPQAVVELAWRK